MADEAAWTEPATPQDAAVVVSYLNARYPALLERQQVAAYTTALAGRYSRAELLAAMHEAPFDPQSSAAYGKALSLPDVERVVRRYRTLRAWLGRALTAEEVTALMEMDASLSWSDFGRAGTHPRWPDQPLFRYIAVRREHRPETEEVGA